MAEPARKKLLVTADNGHCHGHFPGHPIVPAAAQAQWVLDLAMELSPQTSRWEIRQLKLLRELAPGDEVEISLTPLNQGWRGKVEDTDGLFSQMILIAHD